MTMVPSEYPDEAVELTVTFLLPVTEENRSDVDGIVHDRLSGIGVPWWSERIAHYVEYRMVRRYDLKRPPEFVRPRPKKASR